MDMNLLKELIYRLRGDHTTEKLISMGMVVGKNFKRLHGTILDPSHCWLIEIGDDVTLAPRVHILCHDASTKAFLGYTRIGRVTIGNKVFIGANSTVLPGVSIGNDVIIGANSVVTHNIPSNSVFVGNPARRLCSLEEYLEKEQKRMDTSPVFESEVVLGRKLTVGEKQRQKDELSEGRIGFVD